MKKKKLNYINFFITIFLISLLFVIAYFLSNNETFLSKYFISNQNHISNSPIINNRYNKSLEGSIKDSVFDFNANVITIETPKILRKNWDLLDEINISGINVDYNSIKPLKKGNYNNNNSKVTFVKGNNDINFSLFNNNLKGEISNKKNNLDHKVLPLSVRDDNRFKGMVGEYLKTKKTTSVKTKEKTKTNLLTELKNWEKPKNNFLTNFKDLNPKIKLDLKSDEKITFSNLVKNAQETNEDINENINLISYSGEKHKIKIVKKFSKDPLQSVIQNILIPSGLPKTPANVDAVAKGMGLPSGSLGSNISLANSLGISLDELSNPNTKLPSYIVGTINRNENYIGKKLDVNNTTLFDYYKSALKNNFILDFQN